MNIYQVYDTIKEKIYDVVKPYIKENGGYIVPKAEIAQMSGDVTEVSIITEKAFLGRYCLDEYIDAIKKVVEDDGKTKEPMGGGIMDTTNGHSAELVEKINDAWRKGKKNFEIILKALYERDIDEITDSDAFQITKWVGSWQWNEGCHNDNWTPYMDMALADMKEHWEDYAENYLMHIADDADLEAIISFLHYPYLPIWK